jgi:predicted nucleic acid-binding protein
LFDQDDYTERPASPRVRLRAVTRALNVLDDHTGAPATTSPVWQRRVRHYGHIYALVLATGRQPRGRIADLLIASTAVAYDLPLLTRNPKDFVGLDSIVRVVAA